MKSLFHRMGEKGSVLFHDRLNWRTDANPEIRYPDDVELTDNPEPTNSTVGPCESCQHARRIQSARGSVFYLCSRSANDLAFPKYPRIPLLACRGYEPRTTATALAAARPSNSN
jgi:hypothetical protein